MIKLEKPKGALVSFGYPGYPRNLLTQFEEESKKVISRLGIDLHSSKVVIARKDILQARKTIQDADPDFIIVLILSWIEAPNVIAVIKDYLHKPILLWSHTMFKEGGELLTLGPIPGGGVVRETLDQMGANFRFIWGMPEEKKIAEQIKSFSRVAYTISKLSHSKIGLLGYASMGMYTATFDHVSIRKKIGPEIDHLDQYVLIKKAEEATDEEVTRIIERVKKEWDIGKAVTRNDLEKTLKMYIALREIVEDFDWQAFTVKCQYELSKYYKMTPCVPLSMIAEEIPCSCEGDIPLIITQLILHYLTGEVTTYADIHTIEGNSLLMGACGFAPFKLGQGKPRVDKHTAMYEGLSNSTVYKKGKVTLARLASDKNSGYKMHIETGRVDTPPSFHEVGCVQYPSMLVKMDGSGEYFGEHLMSQHYAVVYKEVRKELLELCRLLKIRPL